MTAVELEKITAPVFDPVFELESEIDYALSPVLFETIFRNRLINESLRAELMEFKRETDDIPSDLAVIILINIKHG